MNPPSSEPRSSRLFLAVFLCTVVGLSSTVLAQGKCGYLTDARPSPWFSADFGAGLALPLPTADYPAVKEPAAGLGGMVNLHLPWHFAVGVGVFYKRFEADADTSTYHWGKHLDLLVRGAVAALMKEHVQWDFFLLLGLSNVTVRFMDIDKKNPEVDQSGVPIGPVKESVIWAFSAGAGTRLTVFPIDALGIFLDASTLYSFHPDLLQEWGPLSLSVNMGVDFHL